MDLTFHSVSFMPYKGVVVIFKESCALWCTVGVPSLRKCYVNCVGDGRSILQDIFFKFP